MGKVTRGTLLATLKELKKHKRPKPATTAVAVQAICPQKVKENTVADMKATLERRRVLGAAGRGSVTAYMATDEFKALDDEFNAFITDYISKKDT